MRKYGFIFVLVFGGCTTAMQDKFFAETVDDARRNHQVTREAVVTHDANMTAQHIAQTPEASEAIGVSQEVFDTEMVRVEAKADEIHSSLVANKDAFVKIGLEWATRFSGLPAGPIAGFVTSLVGSEIDKIEEASVGRYESLSADLQSRIAAITQEQLASIVALKDDREAFEAKIIAEVKLSPEETAEMKRMTTEQILAWIASITGAIGLGGLGGSKFGKSRDHEEVLRLNARMRIVEEKK